MKFIIMENCWNSIRTTFQCTSLSLTGILVNSSLYEDSLTRKIKHETTDFFELLPKISHFNWSSIIQLPVITIGAVYILRCIFAKYTHDWSYNQSPAIWTLILIDVVLPFAEYNSHSDKICLFLIEFIRSTDHSLYLPVDWNEMIALICISGRIYARYSLISRNFTDALFNDPKFQNFGIFKWNFFK